jgi:hypothetical protein
VTQKKLWYDEKGCDSKIWQPMEYWEDLAYDECRDIILIEGCLDPNGEPYCSEYLEFDLDCGLDCEEYNPCNGKNGKCRHLTKSLKETGKEFLLKFKETHREDDLIYGNVKVVEYFGAKT